MALSSPFAIELAPRERDALERLAAITQPILELTGGNSPACMTNAGKAVAGTIPGAVHRVVDGQAHDVSATALAPELLEFFIA